MSLLPYGFASPLVGQDGGASPAFRAWMTAMQTALAQALDMATSAVPRTTSLVASGGLQVGGALNDDVGIALYRRVCKVSQLPTVGNQTGDWAYARDGRKASETAGAGTGVPVWWSNGNWYAVDSGVIASA